MNAEKPNWSIYGYELPKSDQQFWIKQGKYWIVDMPIKVLKFWNIQEIIVLFEICIFLFSFSMALDVKYLKENV